VVGQFILRSCSLEQKGPPGFVHVGCIVSNQSQNAFWSDPSISDAQFFITADFVWGPNEAHYSPHRYIISAYVLKRSDLAVGFYYFLEDRYMTSRIYDREAGADILASEKPEILTRLRRLKLEGGSRRLAHRTRASRQGGRHAQDVTESNGVSEKCGGTVPNSRDPHSVALDRVGRVAWGTALK